MKYYLLRSTFLSLILFGALGLQAQNTCFQAWRYTRAVSVTNIDFGLLNDWQVLLQLNTQALISAGKMNPDGSDLRFTTDDCCTEIPYWIQSGINTTNTLIWIRVPQVASNDTSWLQMYYGNPAAPAISDIDLVHFSIGNDSVGTDTATPGITVATQAYTFPFNAISVRVRIFSADAMTIKFKVTNDTNMVTGTTPFFNVPSTPGFYNFDVGMPITAGGHPGWHTSTGGSFLNSCVPSTPCPGSCGYNVYRTGDQGIFGALKTDTCGVLPSMKVWYRRSTFLEPIVDPSWPEFDRQVPFPATAPSGNVMCFNDSLPLHVPDMGAASYQWFYNGNPIPGATDTTMMALWAGDYYCVASTGIACQDIASTMVTISFHVPQLDLGPDVALCSDTGYVIAAPSFYQNYLWDDNTTGITRQVLANGTYSLAIVDSFGCVDADTIGITLFSIPVPSVAAIGSTVICPGESVMLDADSLTWFAYRWLPGGATSSTIQATTPGTYSVIVWDQHFCSDTSAGITVTMLPTPNFELGPPIGYCEDDSVILDAGAGWGTILWPDSSTGQTFVTHNPGFFRVEVTDSNGCEAVDTAQVILHLNPSTDLGGSDTICRTGTVVLDGGPGFSTYNWNTGATTQTVTVGVGVYYVNITDTNGCPGQSNVIYITGYPELVPPVVIGSATLLLASSAPNYQWYVDSVAIPGATSSTHVPQISGTYMVSYDDLNGCGTAFSEGFEAYLDITVDDIPQGFSPNGDGINDQFIIKNIAQFPRNSLLILNRWGSTVFSMAPYDNSFNGNGANGKELPDGTYYYKLDIGNGQTFQDYLIINR